MWLKTKPCALRMGLKRSVARSPWLPPVLPSQTLCGAGCSLCVEQPPAQPWREPQPGGCRGAEEPLSGGLVAGPGSRHWEKSLPCASGSVGGETLLPG